MTSWAHHANTLAERLTAAGELTDPDWRAAFLAVPRHVFVPDRDLAEAYSDDALVTQTRTATNADGASLELPTSSASAPAVVSIMLHRLAVRDGMRVLEIGTGTGYNAALLAHRLGDERVFSVDLDPMLVHAARDALSQTGHRPTVAVADGYTGLPEAAPFDRIIATCAIAHVPPEWIRQLAPGGRIVAPLLGEGWALAVLDKTAPDEVSGRVDASCTAFMPLRPDVDNPLAPGHRLGYADKRVAYYGTTDLDPNAVGDADADLRLFLHLHLPGLLVGTCELPDGNAVTLNTPDGYAEAHVTPVGPREWTVMQRGRRPWDTAEHVVRLWTTLGKPARTRFGISALDDPDRQYIWLDDPDSRHAWPLPL